MWIALHPRLGAIYLSALADQLSPFRTPAYVHAWLQYSVQERRSEAQGPGCRCMASDGLGDDVRVVKGGRISADVFWVAGEDLRWPVQGGGHDDEGVHGVGALLRR